MIHRYLWSNSCNLHRRTDVILDVPKRLCYDPRLKQTFTRWIGTIQKERLMSTKHLQKMMLVGMILISIILAGCERSASTAPPATEPGGQTIEQLSQQQTMDAVRAALLTQTVEPENTEMPTVEPTATNPPPTNTFTPAGPSETPDCILPGQRPYCDTRKHAPDFWLSASFRFSGSPPGPAH